MNNRQMAVLWTGVITFIFLGLFPPLRYGYGFLLSHKSTVQFCDLLIEWVVLSVGTTGLIYYLRGHEPMTRNQRIIIAIAIIILVFLLLFAATSPAISSGPSIFD